MILYDWYSVKKKAEYPWPSVSNSDRTITLYPDDVLCLDSHNTYSKQNGICCTGIHVPGSELTHHNKAIALQIM